MSSIHKHTHSRLLIFHPSPGKYNRLVKSRPSKMAVQRRSDDSQSSNDLSWLRLFSEHETKGPADKFLYSVIKSGGRDPAESFSWGRWCSQIRQTSSLILHSSKSSVRAHSFSYTTSTPTQLIFASCFQNVMLRLSQFSLHWHLC